VRARIADRRVLALVKAFLKAGILTEDGMLKDTDTGTPQGSILSPLLSNVALSVLDEHFARAPGGPASTSWERARRRRQGLPNYRLARYADDWTLMVAGTRNDALALREETAQVLARVGLHLSEEKTLITHIDGAAFLYFPSIFTATQAGPIADPSEWGLDLLTLIDRRQPSWGNFFFYMWDLWRQGTSGMRQVVDILDPVRDRFTIVHPIYSGDERALEHSAQLISESSFSYERMLREVATHCP
jgi:Reverse transcriptase (RNA-dependent DNA polymerase)